MEYAVPILINHVFADDSLAPIARAEKWEKIKIIVRQPFVKNKYFGLEFVRLASPESRMEKIIDNTVVCYVIIHKLFHLTIILFSHNPQLFNRHSNGENLTWESWQINYISLRRGESSVVMSAVIALISDLATKMLLYLKNII